jgi:uncharacterized protein YjbI with pentapeptide repeats
VALRSADLANASLRGADLSDAHLANADLSDANLLGAGLANASLRGADLSDAHLANADLSDANLRSADLSDVNLLGTDLSDANLYRADLSDARLPDASLPGASLFGADLSDTDLREADLSDTDLREADLTGADLRRADLSDADLELSTLIGSNLFDADLTRVSPYGARLLDVQINDGTVIHTNKSEYRSWWQRGPLAPPPRCGYDIEFREREDGDEEEHEKLLSKAADTYKQFEELARDNTLPSLQSLMFVLRQDMQLKRYWMRGEYFPHAFARVSRSIFKYGESLFRVFAWGLLLILGYAVVYARFDLILNDAGSFMQSPVDAIYFSTLTFTTLGLGDFQPDPASEFARALVTSQAALGAILIAIFVFVLGRRAAR